MYPKVDTRIISSCISLDFITGYLAEMFKVAVELTEMIYKPNSATWHFPFYYQNAEIVVLISVYAKYKIQLTYFVDDYVRLESTLPLKRPSKHK